MNLEWLTQYEEETLGPIQRDEAILLFGIACTLRAKRVLEFGSLWGHSARLWLEAGTDEVVCVDFDPTPALRTLEAGSQGRMRIIQRDMAQLEASEMTGPWDIVFFDASHSEAANRATFERLRPYLSGSIVIIHDTGLWAYEHMLAQHVDFPGEDTDLGFAHQPGERRFAQWLQSQGMSRIDFHTCRTLRHGLSMFSMQGESTPSRT